MGTVQISSWVISLMISIIAVLLTAVGLVTKMMRDRKQDTAEAIRSAKNEATEEATIRSEIKFLAQLMKDMKDSLDRSMAGIGKDVDCHEKQLKEHSNRLVAVEGSVKSAHKRIDRLEGNPSSGDQ